MYLILISPFQYSCKGTWNYLLFQEGPTRNNQEPILFWAWLCGAIHTASTRCPHVFKAGPLFNFLSRYFLLFGQVGFTQALKLCGVGHLVDIQMWRFLGTVAKEKRGLVRAFPSETRLLWVPPQKKPTSKAICTETAKWHASGSASFAWSEAHSSMGCSWAKPQGRCERPQGTMNTRERRQ